MQNQRRTDFLSVILWLVRATACNWRKTLLIILTATLFGVVGTGLMEKEYDSQTVIVPPQSATSPDISGALEKMGKVGGMDVSKLLGGSGLGSGASDGELLKVLLASKKLHDAIIDSFRLAEVYKIHKPGDTKPYFYADVLKEFRSNWQVSETDEDYLLITYRDVDFKRGKAVMEYALVVLDSLYFRHKMKEAEYVKEFSLKQLNKTKRDLDSLEAKMLVFQRGKGVLDPEVQMEASLKMIAEAESQKESAKIQMEYEASVNGQNSLRYKRLQEQYEQYDQSAKRIRAGEGIASVLGIAGAAANALEYNKFKREYVIQNALYQFLRQNYEQQELIQAGNIGKFQVVEEPWLNDKKAFPPRVALIALAMILGTALAIVLAAMLEFYAQEKASQTDIYRVLCDIRNGLRLRKP